MFCEKDYVLLFKPIFEELVNRDYFFVLSDLEAFDKKMAEVEKDFLDKETWNKKSLLNVARIGKFTSDRAVMEYANNIWNMSPCEPEEHERAVDDCPRKPRGSKKIIAKAG